MTTQHKNIGLIGLSARPGAESWGERAHLPYLKGQSHYKLTAIQNSSTASAEAAISHFQLEHVTPHGSVESLVQDPNVDIVAVSVSVPGHYALTKPALEAGKDVFVEWPLARNLQEAEELVQLAREKGVKTAIGLQARQGPAVNKVKEYVESGKLGKILGTTMYGHGGILRGTVPEKYAYLTNIENGANLLTIPTMHAVDAFCYALGEFQSLNASLSNGSPKVTIVDGEGKFVKEIDNNSHDFIAINGTLNNGSVASITIASGVSKTGKDFYWEILGTEGTLVLEGPSAHIQMAEPTIKFVGSGPNAKLEPLEVEPAASFSVNVGKAWDAWAGKGDVKIPSFEDALVRHRMIDAIYRSAKEGRSEKYL